MLYGPLFACVFVLLKELCIIEKQTEDDKTVAVGTYLNLMFTNFRQFRHIWTF